MHNILKEALPDAKGRSQYVVVIIADIRGFSEFSTRRESPDTAMYIKRVYLRLIDDYFSRASFFKTTGDGMLITIPYTETEESFREAAQTAVEGCLRCLSDFPNICQGDPMINFDVPSAIGFGLTRGNACCLVSGDKILDYSGQILNLASRLTDLARPAGIVIDGSFGIELLPEQVQSRFESTEVYIRSVAEEQSRRIYTLKGVVEIPEAAKRPLTEQWDTVVEAHTLRWWCARLPRFFIQMPKRLKRPDGIRVVVNYPPYKGGKKLRGTFREHKFNAFDYEVVAGVPRVLLDIGKMTEHIRQRGVPDKAKIEVIISYVPADY